MMIIGLILSLATCFQGSDPVAAWTEDVLHLVSELERLHPDPFFGCPQAEFEEGVDAFLAQVESDGGRNAVVELMRLMGRLSSKGRDGHAVVWPMSARYLPLQLYRFDDGWFVVDAQPAHSARIGARVVSLGGVPVEDACQRLTPLLTFDNEWSLLSKLSAALVCGDVLAGVGVVPDPARVRVELAALAGPEGDEKSEVLELAANPLHLHQLWGRPELPARAGVTWLEGREQSWRLQVLEPERALYVQFNEVRAQAADGESLERFGRRVVETFEQNHLAKVIVDVRSNGGGDNTTFGPLIQALQSPSVDHPGVLFGLIGRSTFSAAGNFVTVLQRDTQAILIGEPTGGAPNQYGDAEMVPLPNHPEVLVRISTRYHQFGKPDDPRLTHEPHLRVPLRAADYFAGRDPVLRAALDYQPPK